VSAEDHGTCQGMGLAVARPGLEPTGEVIGP
jgi:hypothetical protein